MLISKAIGSAIAFCHLPLHQAVCRVQHQQMNHLRYQLANHLQYQLMSHLQHQLVSHMQYQLAHTPTSTSYLCAADI